MNRIHINSRAVFLSVLVFASVVLSVSFVSSFAFAQNSDDELRTSIRANLMSDPRAANLSPAQIDSMVDALAGEAETQGTAAEYLESQHSNDHFAEFVAYNANLPRSTPLALYIALGTLLAVVALGGILIVKRRHTLAEDMPVQGA